jgi:hypothetical protein
MSILKKNLFAAKNRDLIAGSLVIVACFLLFIFFQTKDVFQIATKEIVFFIIIPSLYINFILKKPLGEFGLNLKNKKAGLFWGILVTSLLFFACYFLATYTNFAKEYKIPEAIIGNFHWFLFYELLLINLIIFVQEFFFRGLVLFLFSSKIGAWAIALQGALSIILITAGQKPSWQELPLSLVAFSSGIIAYKSRSFVYSYISALLFQLLLDSYIIYNIKNLANI